MRSRVDETTFPCYTDRSQRVVACDHPASEVSSTQSLNSRRSAWLQFVFEDHQTEEAQSRFGLLSRPCVSKANMWVPAALTVSFSAPSTRSSPQHSSRPWQSLDNRASCSTRASHHNPGELRNVFRHQLLMTVMLTYTSPYHKCRP